MKDEPSGLPVERVESTVLAPWAITAIESAPWITWGAILLGCLAWAFTAIDFTQIGMPFVAAILSGIAARIVDRHTRAWAQRLRFERALRAADAHDALPTGHLSADAAELVTHGARLRDELKGGLVAEPRRSAFEWLSEAGELEEHTRGELAQLGLDLEQLVGKLRAIVASHPDREVTADLVDALEPLEALATSPEARAYR